MNRSQLLARAGAGGHKRVANRAVAGACHGPKTVVVVVTRGQAAGALTATVAVCAAAISVPLAIR